MNFSADAAARKWSSLWHARGRAARTALAMSLLLLALSMQASAAVPLPRSRPAEAPKAAAAHPEDAAASATSKPEEAGSAEPEAAEARPPELSACRLALTESIAIAPSIPPIRGAGGCGGEDLVRLEAVVLSPTVRIAVKPAAILRCKMATAIADWVRNDIAPLAAGLGTTLSELDNFDSFECRGRNRVKGAKLSEHGRANALDVRGLKLANGTSLSLTDRTLARETREKVLASVCARFSTVLGPGSDWYHEDHIHLDLAERRGNYKLCQWGVYDPLPEVAPLLPAERPEEAPPRQTAEERAAQEKSAVTPDDPLQTTESGAAGPVPKAAKPGRKSRN